MTTAKTYIIPVSNGILDSRHRKRIGSAVWVFLFLIDKCTKEQEDNNGGWLGLVLGGSPITARYIAEHLGECERSVRRHLKQLEDGGYIVVLSRQGEASGYAVRKSKKFHRARPFLVEPEHEQDADSSEEPRTELSVPPDKSGRTPGQNCPRNKEDIPEILQRHTPSADAATVPDSGKKIDPRRKDFLAVIDEHLKLTIKDESARPEFHPHVTVPVDRFLKDHSKLNAQGFRTWLQNRANSDGVNFPDMPRTWLPRLCRYACGPLDQFGKPKQRSVTRSQPIPVSTFAEQQRRKIAAATADRANGGGAA
jgi:hypothetical protein